ncbi:MAG: hypothetical protein ABSF91_00130 [Bacteroidota bacterium]|jgi:hypothetical protein
MAALKLSDEYERLIGEIAVAHGHLEFALFYSLLKLIGIGDGALALIGGDNFDVLLAKYRKLLDYYLTNDPLIKEFDLLHKNISEANRDKNECFHAVWYQDEKQQTTAWKFNRRSGVIPFSKTPPVGLDSLKSLNERIRKITTQLFQFEKKCHSIDTILHKHMGELIEQWSPPSKRKRHRREVSPPTPSNVNLEGEPPF